ncbi:MAG TPA: VRR-NUC domain-containing protein [Nitrososphaeraceae archaeon]
MEQSQKSIKSTKRKRNYEEDREQTFFFNWLSCYPKIRELTFAIPNGGSRSRKEVINKYGKKIVISPEGRRLKGMGVTRGFLDVITLIPSKGYHAFLLEMKSNTGKLSPEQAAFIERVEPLGYCCRVAKSWVEARSHLMEYLDKSWFNLM